LQSLAPTVRAVPVGNVPREAPLVASASAAALPASALDDDAWDDLLSFIEERRVIPIVGPELLMVETDRGAQLLFDWAAEKLAARLNVNAADLLGLAPQLQSAHEVQLWRKRIQSAQKASAAGGDSTTAGRSTG